ncbi:hypothetical protein MRX96_052241 [Rhipicephalus microplus]
MMSKNARFSSNVLKQKMGHPRASDESCTEITCRRCRCGLSTVGRSRLSRSLMTMTSIKREPTSALLPRSVALPLTRAEGTTP